MGRVDKTTPWGVVNREFIGLTSLDPWEGPASQLAPFSLSSQHLLPGCTSPGGSSGNKFFAARFPHPPDHGCKECPGGRRTSPFGAESGVNQPLTHHSTMKGKILSVLKAPQGSVDLVIGNSEGLVGVDRTPFPTHQDGDGGCRPTTAPPTTDRVAGIPPDRRGIRTNPQDGGYGDPRLMVLNHIDPK